MTVVSEVEYKADMEKCEEQRKALTSFFDAIVLKNTNEAEEQLKTMENLSWNCEHKTAHVGMVIMEYQTKPWMARYLDDRDLMIKETNEKMHPYLAKFFDIAVRQNMTISDMLEDFKRTANGTNCPRRPEFNHTPKYDGNYEIVGWLDEYAKTMVTFNKQSKTIVEPETFKEYPCLKQYVDYKLAQARIAKNKERLKNEPKLKGKSGVVIADEIAKRQLSGEEKRVITPKVGKELRQEIMKEMNNKKGQRE